ncbi:hypothetical protein DFH09DRAFT_1365966 [Mycena vulgaris]|nr:hypothetical protein DFH09DRAFT_1365966 [Mycena vulgaris]
MVDSTSDKEKGTIDGGGNDPSEEAAAAKLWAVYVSEAEKYDKALVESWKSDMEGMFIFGRRVSSPPVSAAANGSTFIAPVPTVFIASTTSLVCNALWFIILGLSLTCALIATLLQQWARDFLHRADMRSAPVIRARIFSYLYYGLKRFNMHTVVETIPLHLHSSLLFFFAGLVAFLVPINFGIAAVAVALLAIVVALYSLLTLLPLWHLDCPYRTPLSGALWRLSGSLISIWRRRQDEPDTSHAASPETMVEAMSRSAMERPARTDRDFRALVWTVKSLTDDTELEPFVEAIPDVLLLSRIEALLVSCDRGLLAPEASKRRRITCYKALWTIASTEAPQASSKSLKPL